MSEEPKGQRRPTREDCIAAIAVVADGKSLRAACTSLGLHCPSTHTAINEDAGLREQYERARELRAEHFQEEALTVTKAAALGQSVNNKQVDAAGARVYLDAIKWAAARMAPKTAPRIPVDMTVTDLSGLTDEELDALEAIRSKLAVPGRNPGGEGQAGG